MFNFHRNGATAVRYQAVLNLLIASPARMTYMFFTRFFGTIEKFPCLLREENVVHARLPQDKRSTGNLYG